MTLQEFKAWFEGFTENIKGIPTQKQWARIQERVGQIDGKALTQEVVYRYWPWYVTNTYPASYTYTTAIGGTRLANVSNTTGTTVYNTLASIGRNEAANV